MVGGAYAQGNIGIGTNTPDASAKLEISAADAGLLIPRVALTGTSDVATVPPPIAASLLVYNTAAAGDVTPGFYYWNVSVWVRLATGSGRDEDWYEVGSSIPPDNINDNIYTQGNVGVGIVSPAAKLDVMGNVAINDSQLRLRGGADGNHFIRYVGGSIDGVQIQGNLHTVVRSATRDLAWFIDYNTGTNDWPGVYAGAAYLGGQTGGSFGEAVRLVRGRNGDGTLEFMNDGWGRIGGSNGLAFWANGNADGDDAPAMVMHSTGGIGIGTTAAPRGTIDIASFVNTNVGDFTFYSNGAQGGPCCAGNIDIALYADRRVVASEFDALSDGRIKNVIGLTDNGQDLNTLMDIEITDYRMKDALQDTKPYKKVIAQQVEEVYPPAVSKTTNVVCDIYKMATIQNGRIAVENDLQIGEKVKLIFPNGEKILEVTSADAQGFSVDTEQTGEVFVYGREVDDFRVVDYEAISMLNVSATQEQQKLIESMQAEIAALKKENAKLSDMEAKLNAITTALESRGIHVNDSAKK
jgi:hypothetical protein